MCRDDWRNDREPTAGLKAAPQDRVRISRMKWGVGRPKADPDNSYAGGNGMTYQKVGFGAQCPSIVRINRTASRS